MKVHIVNRQKDLPLARCKTKLCQLVTTLLANKGCTNGEIGLFFVSKKEICALHQQFFNDPSSTDCISFPIDSIHDENPYLGDIFICPHTALAYAKKKKLDPYKEVTLYIVHAILHLLGYDDLDPSKRQIMRRQEAIHIKQLERAGLILNS